MTGAARAPGPTTAPSPETLAGWAEALEASGAYRVLRRLPEPQVRPRPLSQPLGARLALFLDLETTGLDHRLHEVIEIAAVPFAYDASGRLLEVYEPFQSLSAPSGPLDAAITALTGLTDADLAGQRIDPAALEAALEGVSLVIAHNAAFDRPFAEKLSPTFRTLPWACSMREVDWAGEGFEGSKLAYLAAGAGFFYDGHRAASDCYAAVALLARPLPRSGSTGLQALLETARRPTQRLLALNTPFELKERLKARGYRWSGGEDGRAKGWYRDLAEGEVEAETLFLEREIYGREADVQVRRITARDRHSERG